LERWINDYLEGGRNALIPDWTCGNRESLFTPEIARFIESSYLQPFGPTIKETHEKIMGTFPGCHISYRLLAYYIINRWNKSYQLLIRNKEEWDRKYSPHARRDWNRVEINECWFSDAKQIDVAYIHNEKVIFPWLTAFIDARSRKFVGWVLTATHDSRAIAQAFVYAVRAHGVPKVIYIDRGKPYKSRAIAGNN
jgi:Integrase core domain.